ncbi:CHAT domain-containing protein [Nostoc sp.]
MTEDYEYKVGGSLEEDDPSYVLRQADSNLYHGLKTGEFCYIFNSRQMGKTSLQVRTMKRLQAEGFACATIDVSGQGSQEINLEQWYAGIVYTLVTELDFIEPQDFFAWWDERTEISPVQRLGKFIEEVMLPNVQKNIVIFVDEIDSILSLDFPTDDFFVFIRSCYEKRSLKPEYKRLTFALVGVATPSDLISDKRRTPFNIGRAIQLNGFKIHETIPLSIGIEGKVENPQAVMQEVLAWTGGQPFLTQKVCKLLLQELLPLPTLQHQSSQWGKLPHNDSSFLVLSTAEWVKRVVTNQIIENWESQDEPPHLKTIRDRIFMDEQLSGRLLGLYQQILQFGEIAVNDNTEQMKLRLTGLVVEQEGKLRVYNQIYATVFNLNWVEKRLANLRPHAEALKAWVASKCQDTSRLLRRQALQDALAWSNDKNLSSLDYQFLSASQEFDKQTVQIALEAEREANQILAEARKKAEIALEQEKKANQRFAEAQRKTQLQIRIGVGVLSLSVVGAIGALIVARNANQQRLDAISKTEQANQQLQATILERDKVKQDFILTTSQLEEAKQAIKTAYVEKIAANKKREDAIRERQQAQISRQNAEQRVKNTNQYLEAAKANLDKVNQEFQHKNSELQETQVVLENEKKRFQQANKNLVAEKANLEQVKHEVEQKNIELEQADQKSKEAVQRARKAETIAEEANHKLQKALEAIVQARTVFEDFLTLTDSQTPLSAKGKYGQVTQSYREFLNLIRDVIKDTPKEAQALSSLGNASFAIGEYAKAQESFSQALQLFRVQKNIHGEGIALNNLGTVYSNLGEYAKALEYYQQSLAISRKIKDKSNEGRLLNNIGAVYRNLGEYHKALEYSQQALSLLKEIGDRGGEGTTLNNMGVFYSSIGEYLKALDYYLQSLAISREIGDRAKEGSLLNNIGQVYRNLGKYTKALEYSQQALLLLREMRFRGEEVVTLNNIGQVYSNLGDYEKALNFYQQSLVLSKQIRDIESEGKTLKNIGEVYSQLGQNHKAIEFINRSLSIARQIKNRPDEEQTLSILGSILFELGNFQEAEKTLFDAIQISESLRTGLADAYKVSIFETQINTYRHFRDILVAQNKTDDALLITESSRSRAFLELLSRRLSPNQNIPLSIKPPNIQQIKQIAKEQNATLVEYSISYRDFKVQGKKQTQESELLIWVIKPSGEVTFRRIDLKFLWQQQKISLADLVVNSRNSIGVVRGKLIVAPVDEKHLQKPLQQLYKLLIEPIADLLPTDQKAHIVFIPEQSLFLVPFAALQDSTGKYLIEKHTILTAPAIQVLNLTHQQRLKPRPTDLQAALVVGNPTMPKVTTKLGDSPKQLSNLPGSEQEAKEIAKLFNIQAFTGNQAIKAKILPKLSQARIIHLATHGLLDDVKGLGVPGAIALAPSGNGELNDGLLTADEILDLKLNADLVVLSACDTGSGRITSDGIIGLSRSFFAAGVPSVIAALWSVPDEPTASLMTEFYHNLQQNPDKAQALRQAMLTTMQKYPDPRNWATFTLIGEAK